MKKRKPPYILVTVILLLGVVVYAFNQPKKDDKVEQQQPEMSQPQGAPNTTDMQKAVQTPKAPHTPTAVAGHGGPPSPLATMHNVYKPKPGNNDTDPGWYRAHPGN